MTKPLANRIALVTGASRGIGYASAVALANAGAHIVAVARTQGGLEELDDEIRKGGGAATLVPLNLTDLDGIGDERKIFADTCLVDADEQTARRLWVNQQRTLSRRDTSPVDFGLEIRLIALGATGTNARVPRLERARQRRHTCRIDFERDVARRRDVRCVAEQ